MKSYELLKLLNDVMSSIFSLPTLLLVVIFIAYFIPSIVAGYNSHPRGLAILWLNVFLGWLFIPWVIALCWALSPPIIPCPDYSYRFAKGRARNAGCEITFWPHKNSSQPSPSFMAPLR